MLNSYFSGPVLSSDKFKWQCIALLSITHIILGFVLLPEWLFAKYPDAAELMRAGNLDSEQAADFSPLYLLMSLAFAPETMRMLQLLAGAALPPLVYIAGNRLFGSATGMISAVFCTFSTAFLVYGAILEPDIFIAMLSAAALAVLSGYFGRKHLVYAVAAGILLGLVSAFRPSGLLLMAGFLFCVFTGWGWKGPRLSTGIALLAAGIIFTALPGMALKVAAAGQPATTMSFGQVWHAGNRPEGSGLGAQFPALIKLIERQKASVSRPDYAHSLYRSLARAEKGEDLTSFECEMFWVGKVLTYIKEEPVSYMLLAGRKAVYFFLGPDGHDIGLASRESRKLKKKGFPASKLILLIGLCGLILVPIRNKSAPILSVGLVVNLILAVLFTVGARYRIAGLPFAAVFGAFFLSSFIHSIWNVKSKPKDILPPVVVLLLVIATMVFSPFLSDTRKMLSRSVLASSYGHDLLQAQIATDAEAAKSAFIQMQAVSPFSVANRDLRGVPFESEELALESAKISMERFGIRTGTDAYFLAVLAKRAGDCESALDFAGRAEAMGFAFSIFDRILEPFLLASECHRIQGSPEKALESIRNSLKSRPGTMEALASAVAALTYMSATEDGISEYERKLFLIHDRLSSHYALSRHHNRWKNHKEALKSAQIILDYFPDAGIAEYEKALALLGLGMRDEALESYMRASGMFPGYPFKTRPFDELVRENVSRNPDDIQALEFAADHELRAGRPAIARQIRIRIRDLSESAEELETDSDEGERSLKGNDSVQKETDKSAQEDNAGVDENSGEQ